MDNFAGSEPRNFIPFYLGERSNGQPRQVLVEDNKNEEPPMNPSTDVAEETVSPGTAANVLQTDSSIQLLPSAIEIIEGTPSQSSTEKEAPETADSSVTALKTFTSNIPHSPDYSPSLLNLLKTDSSSSGESVQSYFTKKVSRIEEGPNESPLVAGSSSSQKESVSEPITINPGSNTQIGTDPKATKPEDLTTAQQLDSPGTESEHEGGQVASKRPRIGSTTAFGSYPQSESRSTNPLGNEKPTAQSSDEMELEGAQTQGILSSSEFAVDTDHDSITNPAGSTIAQALKARTENHAAEANDTDSALLPVGLPRSSRSASLGPSSRALIKEFFTNSEKFDFPKGHATVAFTEDQISTVIKAVADETTRSTIGVIESLIQKASQLRIGPEDDLENTLSKSGTRYPRRAGSVSSGRHSDTSGAIRSDDNFSSIGYSYEGSDVAMIDAPPGTSGGFSCGPHDLASSMDVLDAGSPETQTLAALKAEALGEKSKRTRNRRGKITTKPQSSGARRKITRSCKIMKEAYFQGMEWTRTFVSGPMDPQWNPYKFYCQICKANISIYGKGAREILRHHTSEKHLRKDQRWRYEYLYTVDPVTRTKINHVRGQDGKLLTPYQLEMELPKFIDAPLVEIGKKLPFYDEYMAGADYMSSSSGNRARVQLSVLAKFLPFNGDIELLKSFWGDVGVIVNHQSLFTDFNWGEERLSVSSSLFALFDLGIDVSTLDIEILVHFKVLSHLVSAAISSHVSGASV